MKKLFKPLLIFVFGIISGYYICYTNSIKNIFSTKYKAFQVGVYTNLETAKTYSSKYTNSIVIKENELYRVYIAILKDSNNIENMKKYLNKKGIEYYLKDIELIDQNIKNTINQYENIMDINNEVIFIELNKKIMEEYKNSL